jgi:uncharacterized protein YxjI
MRGAIHLLPNTPSWHGEKLKHGDKFTLPLPSGHRMKQVKKTMTNLTDSMVQIRMDYRTSQLPQINSRVLLKLHAK